LQNPSLTDHLEKLRYFCEIAQAGSLGKAARALRVAQPTLSHSVKVLEGVLSTDLLVRTSSGVQLTPAGRRLHEFSRKLLTDTSALEHELRLGHEGTWNLSVGTKEPFAVSVWPVYLKTLRASHPELEVSLSIERKNRKLMDRLGRQEIDVALIADPEEDEHVVAFPIFSEHFGFFSPSGKLRADERLFIFQRSFCGGGRTMRDALQEGTFGHPERMTDVDSFPAARAMALAGLGAALLPFSFANPEVQANRLKECEIEGLPATLFGSLQVCLCVHKKDVRDKRLRELRRVLRNVAF